MALGSDLTIQSPGSGGLSPAQRNLIMPPVTQPAQSSQTSTSTTPQPEPNPTPSTTDMVDMSGEARTNVDAVTAMNGLPDLQSAYPEGEGSEGTSESGSSFYSDWYPAAEQTGTGEAPSAEGAETPEIPGTDSPGGEQPSDDMVLPSWDDDNPYGGEGGVNARNVGVEEWDGPGGNQNDNLESIISSNLGIDPSKLYEQLPDGGTLLDKVAEANGIEDPNMIQAGQDLVIPTMDEVPPEQLQERAITGANSADESYSQMNEQIDGLGLDEQQSAQLQESQYNQSFQGALADNPEMKQKVDEVFAMQNGPEKTEALAQLQDQVNNWRNENPFMAQQSDALGAAEWATGQANEQGEIPENIMGMVDTASQVSGNVSDAVSSVAGLSNTDPSVAGDLLQDINQWTTEGRQVKPFDLPSARRPAA